MDSSLFFKTRSNLRQRKYRNGKVFLWYLFDSQKPLDFVLRSAEIDRFSQSGTDSKETVLDQTLELPLEDRAFLEELEATVKKTGTSLENFAQAKDFSDTALKVYDCLFTRLNASLDNTSFAEAPTSVDFYTQKALYITNLQPTLGPLFSLFQSTVTVLSLQTENAGEVEVFRDITKDWLEASRLLTQQLQIVGGIRKIANDATKQLTEQLKTVQDIELSSQDGFERLQTELFNMETLIDNFSQEWEKVFKFNISRLKSLAALAAKEREAEAGQKTLPQPADVILLPTSATISAPSLPVQTSPKSGVVIEDENPIRKLLERNALGLWLSPEETTLLKNLPLTTKSRIATASDFKTFTAEENTVVRFRLNYKLTNVYKSSSKLLDLSGKPLDPRVEDVGDLNHADFSTELYLLVMQNDGEIQTEFVLNFFYNLFATYFQPVLSQYVVLDCIQLQHYWPTKALGAFDQKSFDIPGAGSIEEPVSSKPFAFYLYSSMMRSRKNAFKFMVPGILAKYKDPRELASHKPLFDQFSSILSNPIFLGDGQNVELQVVIPTRKANALEPFVVVTDCFAAGFTGNYKRGLAFRNFKSSP